MIATRELQSGEREESPAEARVHELMRQYGVTGIDSPNYGLVAQEMARNLPECQNRLAAMRLLFLTVLQQARQARVQAYERN